jgi:uncharacterized protein YjbI with pentapeptide repeats
MKPSPPPKRAVVRPRVVAFEGPTQTPKLLEDLLAELLAQGRQGTVFVTGPLGFDVTEALRHVAHVFRSEAVRIADGDRFAAGPPSSSLVVVRGFQVRGVEVLAQVVLAPWTKDDLIEYLLDKHKDKCGDVLMRLMPERWYALMQGTPSLWAPVLNLLAKDETVADIVSALRIVIARRTNNKTLARLRRRAFDTFVSADAHAEGKIGFDASDLLELDATRRVLVIDETLDRMHGGRKILSEDVFTFHPMLDDLVAEVPRDPRSIRRLESALLGQGHFPASLAASVLHRLEPERLAGSIELVLRRLKPPLLDDTSLPRVRWPASQLQGLHARRSDLRNAHLPGANLEAARLETANLADADLSGATLHEADLFQASLRNANLMGANLTGACLGDVDLTGAQLTCATLVYSDLRFARLSGTNLELTDLTAARLDDTDLREVRIDGSFLVGTSMMHSQLGGLVASHLDGTGAKLSEADLTASRLRDVCLVDADLTGAGLADVDWEGIDLRGADLTHASFHLGSSRSGLVVSGYPSQGTRTGFYTEDGLDLTHRPPEEIRKANLRGARLRGAKVFDTDFYLVDLRDAEYDAGQEAHFRACGAILEYPPA